MTRSGRTEKERETYKNMENRIIRISAIKESPFLLLSNCSRNTIRSTSLLFLLNLKEGRCHIMSWNFTSVLEDVDFADDIALLSSRFSDFQEKTERLAEEEVRVDLKLHATKCNTMRSEHTSCRENIALNGEVEEFVYLGAIVAEAGKILRTDCRRHMGHSRDCGRCG